MDDNTGTRIVEPATRRVPDDLASLPGDDGSHVDHPVFASSGTRMVRPAGVESQRGPETARPRRRTLGHQPAGAVICADCIIVETLEPQESKDAGLYLCNSPEGRVIVKVAPLNHPPKRDLFDRLSTLQHPHVLRTYRAVEMDGLFYEVQEYCTGGSLGQRIAEKMPFGAPMPLNELQRNVLPQLNAGLKYLHGQGIIHRDIKPSNVYIRVDSRNGEEQFVLGDFDISSLLHVDETSRETSRAAGTWVYTAPEAFPRFVDDGSGVQGRVTRSADYYSLGMTLLEALAGTTSLHTCELPDLFDFYLQGARVAVPSHLPENVCLLLNGLLIRNRRTRWGAEEVDRWLRGVSSDEDVRHVREDESYALAHASRPYDLRGQPTDLLSLADAMELDWATASEDLTRGDVLINWIGNLNAGVAREIRRYRDRFANEPLAVLQAAIQLCDPKRPLKLHDGTVVASASEWADAADRMRRQNAIAYDKLGYDASLLRLAIWLERKSRPEPHLADEVFSSVEHTPRPVRIEDLQYLFQPNRPYMVTGHPDGPRARTPAEVSLMAYGKPVAWDVGVPEVYTQALTHWREGFLCAWLRRRNLPEVATRLEEIAADTSREERISFEVVLRQLNAQLKKPAVHLDLHSISQGLNLELGQKASYAIPYHTVGPGIPYVSVEIVNESSALTIDDPALRKRLGTLTLKFDTRDEPKTGEALRAVLRLRGGYTDLVPSTCVISYRVSHPRQATLSRLVGSTLLGAGLMAAARASYSLMAHRNPVSFMTVTPGSLWTEGVNATYNHIGFIPAGVVFGVCFVIGWRAFLRVVRTNGGG